MIPVAALVGVLWSVAGDVEPAPDVVQLENGRVREGRVVFEDDGRVVLRVKSREQEIAKAEIASLRAALRELPRALDEIAALRPGDLVGHHALSGSLDERNLPFEARLVDWLILVSWPADEEAHERLGHRRRGKDWTVPHSGRWYRLEDREALLDDWGDAWELRSTHFRVRSNLPLEDAVRATLDLERTYRAFYGLLGAELELWEITEPIDADLHADSASFPDFDGGGRSYFSTSDRRLIVNASGGPLKNAVVHEASHALVYFSTVHTRSGRGDMPGWLDEGLAEYMQTGLLDRGGGLEFTLGWPSPVHFPIHAGSKKPYRLGRVLNLESNDFGGTSKTDLKYAQAYTLVHYCLHGEDGRLRERFFEYLRQVYEGKGSSTAFKKAMGVREKELEEAWHAYAAAPPR